ncbi:MAG: hypothetical protein KatS3mg008_1148 [Acidimicrobiales bacterium]|nr:MAG: hypothetical protein KatS3mg008_1148 [Acidimicrobiales bacterium]
MARDANGGCTPTTVPAANEVQDAARRLVGEAPEGDARFPCRSGRAPWLREALDLAAEGLVVVFDYGVRRTRGARRAGGLASLLLRSRARSRSFQ